jgi:hypothetical protein
MHNICDFSSKNRMFLKTGKILAKFCEVLQKKWRLWRRGGREVQTNFFARGVGYVY